MAGSLSATSGIATTSNPPNSYIEIGPDSKLTQVDNYFLVSNYSLHINGLEDLNIDSTKELKVELLLNDTNSLISIIR